MMGHRDLAVIAEMIRLAPQPALGGSSWTRRAALASWAADVLGEVGPPWFDRKTFLARALADTPTTEAGAR
jgi:hypothetical protein